MKIFLGDLIYWFKDNRLYIGINTKIIYVCLENNFEIKKHQKKHFDGKSELVGTVYSIQQTSEGEQWLIIITHHHSPELATL